MQLPIYLDNQATTPCDPRVVDAMLPYFTEKFGNSASTAHPFGWKAKEAVEAARAKLANLAGCEPAEIVFTSGATEAINLVLKGVRKRDSDTPPLHVITAVTEHSAVLDTCDFLEKQGARITRLPVNGEGKLYLNQLEETMAAGADLVSLMHANNEIGTIHPIEEVAAVCQKYNVPLHVDAAQSLGKIPVKFRDWNLSFLSLSGHKMYAPKGIGALIIRRQVPPLRLVPLIHGGGHERGFRSGTLNVPAIVALGAAAEICLSEMDAEAKRAAALRNHLLARLKAGIPELVLNGSLDSRLPGNLNLSIPAIEAQRLLPSLRDTVSLSSGSACTSAKPLPSHVLAALGRSLELAYASLRFGIGRFNTREEIDKAADAVIAAVKALRIHR